MSQPDIVQKIKQLMWFRQQSKGPDFRWTHCEKNSMCIQQEEGPGNARLRILLNFHEMLLTALLFLADDGAVAELWVLVGTFSYFHLGRISARLVRAIMLRRSRKY